METINLIHKLKKSIEPTRDLPQSSIGIYYYPCGVILIDGTKNDNVYFVNKKDFIRHAGWIPKEEFTIHLEDVVDIYESPYRLPKRFAQEIYNRGETGMGFYGFWIIMKDGQKFPYITGGAVDLIELPERYSIKDIKELGPSTRRGDGQRIFRNKPYYWCLIEDL